MPIVARDPGSAITVAQESDLDGIARYHTTVVQGLSIRARDGADRAELEVVISCAMAAWETLARQD